MKNLLIFAFFVSIPAFLFLGHDVYNFYANQNQAINAQNITKIATEKRPGKEFDFTSIGYLLNKYSPSMHQALLDSMTTEEETKQFKLFLTYKGFYLSVAFALVMTALAAVVIFLKGLETKIRNTGRKSKSRRKH